MSRIGIPLGVLVVLVGTLSVQLCRRAAWVTISIFMVVAQTLSSRITKMKLLKVKRLLAVSMQIAGCMQVRFALMARKCLSHWATSLLFVKF